MCSLILRPLHSRGRFLIGSQSISFSLLSHLISFVFTHEGCSKLCLFQHNSAHQTEHDDDDDDAPLQNKCILWIEIRRLEIRRKLNLLVVLLRVINLTQTEMQWRVSASAASFTSVDIFQNDCVLDRKRYFTVKGRINYITRGTCQDHRLCWKHQQQIWSRSSATETRDQSFLKPYYGPKSGF